MMELFSFLDERERRTVSLVAAVCGSLVILLAVFGVKAWVDAGRSASRRAAIEAEWTEADRARNVAVAEWSRRDRAETDIRELGESWFYSRARGVREMRSDLGAVLKKAGVAAAEIVYGDAEVVKGRLRRVTAGFSWAGSYAAFRRLLETLEAHPRALFVSKVDFRAVAEGRLEAGIMLEGYFVDE